MFYSCIYQGWVLIPGLIQSLCFCTEFCAGQAQDAVLKAHILHLCTSAHHHSLRGGRRAAILIFGFDLHSGERCIPIAEPSRCLWSVRAAAAGLHSEPFSQPLQASIRCGSQFHVELSARPKQACWTRASLSHLEPLDRSRDGMCTRYRRSLGDSLHVSGWLLPV